jgi:hypothetical protein
MWKMSTLQALCDVVERGVFLFCQNDIAEFVGQIFHLLHVFINLRTNLLMQFTLHSHVYKLGVKRSQRSVTIRTRVANTLCVSNNFYGALAFIKQIDT